jgi:hypothetical protein
MYHSWFLQRSFYLLLFTFIYFYLLLFTFVYFCLLLLTFVNFCLLLFTFVYFCLLLFTFVYFCLLLFKVQVIVWLIGGLQKDLPILGCIPFVPCNQIVVQILGVESPKVCGESRIRFTLDFVLFPNKLNFEISLFHTI